jgi:hypothetical protein
MKVNLTPKELDIIKACIWFNVISPLDGVFGNGSEHLNLDKTIGERDINKAKKLLARLEGKE